jgi:hypothetical protein
LLALAEEMDARISSSVSKIWLFSGMDVLCSMNPIEYGSPDTENVITAEGVGVAARIAAANKMCTTIYIFNINIILI